MGTVLTVGATTNSGARIIAPLALTALYELDPALPYLLAGCMALVCSGLYLVLHRMMVATKRGQPEGAML